MLDYMKRMIVVTIIAVCVGIIFIGGTNSRAETFLPNNWVWPTEGRISDHFGTRDGRHKGLDIAGELNTNVVSVSEGVVSKSYYSDSYGHVVFVYHEKEGYETVYAHLNKRLVAEGEHIKQGEMIGKMGNTGRSSGVHLHFEVHKSNWSLEKENAINPLVVLNNQKEETAIETAIDTHKHEAIEKEDENSLTIHKVKEGETLWSLSKVYDVSIAELQVLNNLGDETTIFVNQQLIVKQSAVVYVNPLF